MSKRAATRVIVSSHALARWLDYVGNTTGKHLARRVRRHLQEALRQGMEVDKTGAGHVEVKPGIWAVIVPEVEGGYSVVTFHRGLKMQTKQALWALAVKGGGLGVGKPGEADGAALPDLHEAAGVAGA
ncbi:MAG: hypothetical protein C4570_06495 [Ammonifex sp.]|jgi:phytoene/squalene synthetase|nr:MAG: hypothetical protein C4570_06495 [Ammonifex sp.]